MRVEKAKEKQMLMADSRQNTLRRLRSIRAAMKLARAEARKKKKQDKQDSIRNRILRRLAKPFIILTKLTLSNMGAPPPNPRWTGPDGSWTGHKWIVDRSQMDWIGLVWLG